MKYETPKADLILFDDADIIRTSGEPSVLDDTDPYGKDKFVK